ncbi:MAG: hypothetical protein O6922_08765 [Chloroflexi bacterium]|nr:hypothetical protein [Chloroflexota bacterium]
MTTTIDPVVVARDLRKKYEDIQAVDGISFQSPLPTMERIGVGRPGVWIYRGHRCPQVG